MGRVVAEDTERSRIEQKMPPIDHGQPDPSRSQRQAELAMGEQRYIAVHRDEMRDQPVGAGGDLFGRFAAGTTVLENIPTGALLSNIQG
jgi:ribosomal protein L2